MPRIMSQQQNNGTQNQNPIPREANVSVEQKGESNNMFSPRFRSVAAMAGWDEEALLLASLVVEDTPDRLRLSKHKKRPDLHFKTPPTHSRRKRRAQRKSPTSIPVAVLNLDEDDEAPRENEDKKKTEGKIHENVEKETGNEKLKTEAAGVSSTSDNIPCMDRLREELSCAICLEICFKPSTTPCGHSFCKKCLRSAADKCGRKCPKCRQLISNGRSCTVNTVLWNTIQLLFPQEVEARKSAAEKVPKSPESRHERQNAARASRHIHNRNHIAHEALNGVAQAQHQSQSQNFGRRNFGAVLRSSQNLSRREASNRSSTSSTSTRRRRDQMPSQDEDAALALRLQREEFMEAFSNVRSSNESEQNRTSASSVALATANLRAMASRARVRAATLVRLRGQSS